MMSKDTKKGTSGRLIEKRRIDWHLHNKFFQTTPVISSLS